MSDRNQPSFLCRKLEGRNNEHTDPGQLIISAVFSQISIFNPISFNSICTVCFPGKEGISL